MESATGFCAVYRFRLKPGFEESFQQAWTRLTEAIRDTRGGLGSRLHLADDGWWLAYAQWPDRQSWEGSRDMPPADPDAANTMNAAIVERLPPILMDAKIDLLVRRPALKPG